MAVKVTGQFEPAGDFSIVDGSDVSGNITGSNVSASGTGTFNTIEASNVGTTLGTMISGSTPFNASDVSGSWRGEFSSSNMTVVGGGISGSAESTGSFGRIESSTVNIGSADITGNLTVAGNYTVNGTTTFISSSQLDIGDNIIQVNSVNPLRYGGIHVKDVTAEETGSLVWDSTNDYWLAGQSGSEYRIPLQDSTSDLTDNKTIIAGSSGRLESGDITDTGDSISMTLPVTASSNLEVAGNISGSATSTGSFGHITTPAGINAVGPFTFQTTAAANDTIFRTAGTSGYPLTLRNSNNSARMYFQTNAGVTNIIMDGNSKSNLLKLSADGLTETRGQVGSAHADGNLELYSNNGLNNLILSASMTTISGSGDTTLDVKGNILSEGNISGSVASTGSFGVLELVSTDGMAKFDFTKGTNNFSIGYGGTGQTLTTGAVGNVFLGYGVGSQVTTGDQNVGLGYQVITGGNATGNTAVGYRALKAMNSGIGNVAIGRLAGDAVQTGNYNIAIGQGTGFTGTGATNQIGIGYDVTVPGDNQTVIGASPQTHVIFGGSNTLISGSAASTGSFGDGRFASKVGIGLGIATALSTPHSYLDVRGNNVTPSNGNGSYHTMQLIDTTAMAEGVGGGIGFGGKFVGNTDTLFGEIRGLKENGTSNNYAGALTFQTRAHGANLIEQVRIDSSGNLEAVRGNISGSSTSTGSFGRVESNTFDVTTLTSTTVTSTNLNVTGEITGSSLDISGNMTGSANLEVAGNISGSATSTGSFGAVYVDNAIGLGITNPGSYVADNTPLVLGTGANNSTGTGVAMISATNGYGNLYFGDGTGVNTYRGAIQYFHTSDSMKIWTSGNFNSPSLLLDNSKNIEIGGNISGSSTSTGSFGHLELANRDTDASFEFGRAHIGFVGYSDMAGFSHVDNDSTSNFALAQSAAGKTIVQAKSGQPIAFKIGGSDKVQINSSGDLGIGIETALHKLHVVGDGFFTGNVSGSATSTGSFGYLEIADSGGSPTIHLNEPAGGGGDSAVRMTEDGGFRGGFIKYDGGNNLLKIGTHANNNRTVSDDITAIEITRNDGYPYFKTAYAYLNQYLAHEGDDDTYLRYQTNQIDLSAGGNIFEINTTSLSGSSTSTGSFAKITAADRIEVNGSGTGQVYIGTTSGQVALHAANDSIIQANHFQSTQNSNSAVFLYDDNGVATRIHGQNHVRFTFGSAASGYDDRTFFKVASRNSNTYADTLLSGSLHITGSGGDLGSVVLTGNVSGSSTSTGSFGTLRIDGGVIDFDNANNTFIGKNSKSSVIDGADSNTVVGTNAGSALTSGDDNTLIGYNAGNDLTSGHQNTLIGYTAGDNITTQQGNVLIGKNTGGTGQQLSILIGNDTGRLIASGNGTVGIGHNTLYSLSTGQFNTVVGYDSMRFEVDGDRSTAFGYQTLRSQTGTDGTVGTTALGYKAGYNATSGIHNIFVGADTNPSSGSSNNEIVIGYGVTGLGDNQTVIGNSSQTHVVFGGDALISGSASSTGSFGDGRFVGKLGIGEETAPDELLHLKQTGNDFTTIQLESTNGGTGAGSQIDMNFNGAHFYFINHGTGRTATRYGTTVAGFGEILAQDSNYGLLIGTGTKNKPIIFGTNNAEVMRIEDGKVSGSSTSTGSFGHLELANRDTDASFEFGRAHIGFIGFSDMAGFSHVDHNGTGTFALAQSSAGKTIVQAASGQPIAFKIGGTDKVQINSSGDLGIGIETALHKLHVVGDGFFTGNVSGSSTSTGSFGRLAVGTATIQIPSNGFITMGSLEGMVMNTRFGNNAGQNLQAGGTQNVIVGEDAGAALTTGDTNVAVGSEALKAATGDSNNVAIGRRALHDLNATNARNVAVGTGAGDGITSGTENVLLGHSTNASAVGGDNQIAIGSGVTGTGDNQTVIGNSSQTHVVFGGDALISGSAKSTGSFGRLDVSSFSSATATIISGSTNPTSVSGSWRGELSSSTMAVVGGGVSGSSISTGSFGSVMQNGKHFPQTNAPGENIAFGTDAGSAFVGGNVNKINVAIGLSAGSAMADYGGNVFIGKNAAKLRTRGDDNVAIGTSAGGTDGDDFGDKNVFIGLSTGLAINSTNSDANVFIGSLAGTAGQQSIANVLIGSDAGKTLTNSSRNVAIGAFAGTGFGVTNTTTENSIYIGQYARTSVTNANNEIVIGSEAVGHGTDTITFGDNQITDVYFASGSSTGATFHGVKDFSGNISGSSTSTGSFGRVEATTVSASHYVGQIGSRYVHSQTSDSTTWAITHNIGHKYPVVTVYDTDDQIMLPETGTATDSDTFTLTFNEAIQGTAILSVGGVGTNAGNNYIHTQSETSTNWRVTHSLSQQYPNITVFDENDEVIIPESITATSDNNADIVFSSDQIGYANFSIGSGIPNISSENSGKFLKVRHDGEGVEWVPTTANVSGSMSVSGSILPDADNHHDLGSAEKRWANLFTGDIELSNEGSEGNEVDGTTGSWTIQEGEDDLYLLNRKNGKKYKFKLQEIE